MLKKSIMLILLSSCTSLYSATWKVFFYMDSSDSLSDMAFKNITDMIREKPNDSVEFIIQLHAYYQAGLRYRVTEHGLKFLEEVTLTGDPKQDFITATSWAFNNNTSDYTMLILSNHGWGILDPRWNDETQKWEADADALSNSCVFNKKNALWREIHKRHKGFMFTVTPRTYLNNQDMIDGFTQLNTLLGNKLDIIAFDTCMGDMFEVAYQLAPFARYLVGSQSCSLSDGFNYRGIMHILNQQPASRELAAGMVQTFEDYYSTNDDSGIYTHAALDLSHIQHAKRSLDHLIDKLLMTPDITPLLMNACDASPRFCMWPMYTDLIAFCQHIEKELNNYDCDQFSEIKSALHHFYHNIKPLIVARCGGSVTEGQAHGVAIYLPSSAVHESYYKTIFAQESRWLTLLEQLSAKNTL